METIDFNEVIKDPETISVVGKLLKYSVKKYDFGELIIMGSCPEILIRKKVWMVGEEITIPGELDGMKLNRGGLLMIQNLSVAYDIGIYTLGTIAQPLIELRYVVLDNTLSTPNKINIKKGGNNFLSLKNNLSNLNLSARIILLNE